MANLDTLQSNSTHSSELTAELTLVRVLSFFSDHWRAIVYPAVLTGLIVGGLWYLFSPKQYSTSTVLVISPPKFASSLKPSTLTVQGYQELMRSDAVINETCRRLRLNGTLSVKGQLQIDQDIHVRIFTARTAEQTSLAPMLEILASGKTPEQAAAIANAWAEVFLERNRQMASESTLPTVQFVEEQYAASRDALSKARAERVRAANDFHRRWNEAYSHWDQRINEFLREGSVLIATESAENRRLLDHFSRICRELTGATTSQRPTNGDTAGSELSGVSVHALSGALPKRTVPQDRSHELIAIHDQLQQKQIRLDSARQQLASLMGYKYVPPKLDWMALETMEKEGEAVKRRVDEHKELVSNEPVEDAVHAHLRLRVADMYLEANALAHQAADLVRELTSSYAGGLDNGASAATQPANDAALGIEKLAERNERLSCLLDERGRELADLLRQQQRELDGLARAREMELDALGRKIKSMQLFHDQLSANAYQAALAKAQLNIADVQLAAPAIAPDNAQPRGTATKALLASVVAAVCGLLVALTREVRQRERLGLL